MPNPSIERTARQAGVCRSCQTSGRTVANVVKQKLLTVEDTFQIEGRGLIVVPGPLLGDHVGPRELQVELRKPNGTTSHAVLSVMHSFQTPPPKEHRWVCMFKQLSKAEVPLGTEVWYEGAA